MPWVIMFMAPMRSMVRSMSKPVEHVVHVKWSYCSAVKEDILVVVVLECTPRRPPESRRCRRPGRRSRRPPGGSHQLHHHVPMMCLGVRNWPFWPAVANLPSMYSYRSPCMSNSAMIMLVQIIQPGDDLLQHLGRGDQKHGVAHIAGKGGIHPARRCSRSPAHFQTSSPCSVNIRQMAVLHIFNSGEHPLGRSHRKSRGDHYF